MMHDPLCVSHHGAWRFVLVHHITRDYLSKLLSLLVVACLVKKQLQAALASMTWQLHVTQRAQSFVCWCGC